jgi:hypothetical protein
MDVPMGARRTMLVALMACGTWLLSPTLLKAQPAPAAQELSGGLPAPLAADTRPTEAAGAQRPLRMDLAPASPAAGNARQPEAEVARIPLWIGLGSAAYGGAIVGDVVNGGLDFPELFVPVAGPFIAIARYDNVVTNPYYAGRTRDKVLFAGSGAMQALSLVMILTSARAGHSEARLLKKLPLVTLAATGRGGFAVTGVKRF